MGATEGMVVGEGGRRRILDPLDRMTEVIFGLLMAMTFIGSLSVATAGREEARTMLIAAFGCNLAWGLADAVMYLLRTWMERTRNRTLLARLQEEGAASGHALLAEALPPRIAAAAGIDGLELLRRRLLEQVDEVAAPRLALDDWLGALGTFLLVVLATFPPVIPFLLIDTTALAIRTSNLVALAMLFAAGGFLARHAGGNPWASGAMIAVVGALLMLAIIALGG